MKQSHLLLIVCLIAGGLSCKVKPKGQHLSRSPAEAFTKLATAGRAGQAGEVYDLMSTSSRWAVMSIYKDMKAMCSLIKAHYPKDRQAAAYRRCQDAVQAGDDREFYIALSRGHGLGKDLKELGDWTHVHREGTRAMVSRDGKSKSTTFCKEDKGWGYCGLSEELERLKVKTARDLITVKENAESFKGASR